MKLISTVIFFYIIFFSQGNAQSLQRQCIASAGSSMSDNGTLIRQTIGQPYGTTSYYSNEIRFNPGFQQPVFIVETIMSIISATIFPNPTAQQVTIETEVELENARVQVIDINGKLLLDEKVGKLKSYTINCSDWANGSYFITLSDSKHDLYASKLIIAK